LQESAPKDEADEVEGDTVVADMELIPGGSLKTQTPEAGRQLAMKLARMIIKVTQPDADERARQRDIYSTDPSMMIALGQTVAIEFATIAAANDYWK
jgi:hypothetical protein